jgi:hypothetical protein
MAALPKILETLKSFLGTFQPILGVTTVVT